MIKLSYKKIFYSILSVALIVRVYIVFLSGLNWVGNDTITYFNMANGILNGNPISYFPNGYPLLLAGILSISFTHADLISVSLNIILQIASLIIIEKILTFYKIDYATILLILLIITFYPNQVSRVRFIMSEPASVFLVLLSLLLYIRNKSTFSGFTGWLSYSFRPSLLLVSLLIIIRDLLKKDYAKSLKSIFGFAGGAIIFAGFTFLGLTASPNNHNYNALVAIQSYGYDIKWDLSDFTEQEKSTPIATYLKFAYSNPSAFIKQRALSLYSLWGPIVETNYGIIGKLLHGIRFPFFIIACFVFLFRRKLKLNDDLIILLSYPIFSVTIMHILFFSQQRHQFPAEPFVIILAVLGIMQIVRIKFS